MIAASSVAVIFRKTGKIWNVSEARREIDKARPLEPNLIIDHHSSLSRFIYIIFRELKHCIGIDREMHDGIS